MRFRVWEEEKKKVLTFLSSKYFFYDPPVDLRYFIECRILILQDQEPCAFVNCRVLEQTALDLLCVVGNFPSTFVPISRHLTAEVPGNLPSIRKERSIPGV